MPNKKFRRIYLAEWRLRAGWRQTDLAREMKLTDVTISRWETGARRMDTEDLTAAASTLSRKLQFPLEPQDLFRHPDTISLDSMLRGASDAKKRQAAALIRAISGDGDEK